MVDKKDHKKIMKEDKKLTDEADREKAKLMIESMEPGNTLLEMGNKASEKAFTEDWDKTLSDKPSKEPDTTTIDEARALRVRARTVKQLPMAYRIDEKVVQAWRGYVLKECGSQLGAGPLLEEILREYLPTHGFPIGEA